MRRYTLLLFVWMCVAWGCSEEDIMKYSDNTLYVYFEADATADSLTYSFKAYPKGEIRVRIPMKSNGVWLSEDREYTVSADERFTTLPSELYKLPEKCMFPAGQSNDTIEITLLNGEVLKDKACRLMLKVDETEWVKEGDDNYTRSIIWVSDKLERPLWWSVWDGGYGGTPQFNIAEYIYLGDWSETKYTMFLEELAKDGVEFDGTDRMVLKKYSLRLKHRIEAFNADPENIASGKAPLKDEFGNEMVIPVVG